MPRRRTEKLPPNLYAANGGRSFRYRHPVTGKWFGMGADRTAAVRDALELNARLVRATDNVRRVEGRRTVSQVCEAFTARVAGLDYAPKTLEMYQTATRKISRAWGEQPADELTVEDVAALIDAQAPRAGAQLRQVLVEFFAFAMAKGWRDDNPAARTLKPQVRRQRQRLTIAQYRAIHTAAAPWLQRAMDLALLTLQRRSDLVALRWDRYRDGVLYLVQGKTGAALAIQCGGALRAVIDRCRDDIASPFIVHRMPEKRPARKRAGAHWSAVAPEMLSRAFADARDRCGLFDSTPPAARPSFHELRALGIKLYRDAGEDAQKLAGHADASMTDHYDTGHNQTRYQPVAANLKMENEA